MKTKILISVLSIVLAISAAACGATPTPTPTGSALATTYADALSARNQLLLGTLRLQGTANAVAAAQAKQLLPLWQALKGLTTTQTAVSAEITALQQQIERAMTPAQMQAIAGLSLTNADLTAWYTEQGVVLPTPVPGVTSQSTPGTGAGRSSTLSTADREATRTAQGTMGTPVSGGNGGTSRSTILMDKVIELLTLKASGA